MPEYSCNTESAIVALIVWGLTLLGALGIYRSYLTLARGNPANSFAPTGLDLQPFGQRLTRAHANAYEFLPFALAMMLLAVATDRAQVTDGMALWLVALRLGQSTVHLISTSAFAVVIRFVLFFIPQIAIVAWWGARLL